MTDTNDELIREGEAAVIEYGKAIAMMQEPLKQIGRRIDEAYAQTQRGRLQWIEGTLKLACALVEARDRFPSNNDFGVWIVENGHNHIGDHDRAALINMASPRAIEVTRIVLTETNRMSWRHIWLEEIEPRLGHMVKTTKIVEPAENPAKVVPIAPPQQTATPQADSRKRAVNKNSSFHGRERADDVQAVYQHANTRSDVGRALAGDSTLWPLILAAIDAGFLTKTNYQSAHRRLTLRILFPHDAAASYCRSIDLSTPQARKRVRDFILPAMIANKDAILANPSQIGQIMNRAEYDARVKANEAAATKRLAERRAAMPKHEYEVIVYGEHFWPNPRPEVTDYTYDQCRAACWYFFETDDLYKVTAGGGDNVKGRAMMMRFSTRWFTQYADREMTGEQRDRIKMVFRLVHAMANAMQHNPSGTSNRPPSPTTDGEWP